MDNYMVEKRALSLHASPEGYTDSPRAERWENVLVNRLVS